MADGMPSSTMPVSGPAVALVPAGLLSRGEPVLSLLCGAREAVAEASRVPLADASSGTLTHVIAAAARLRSVTQALMLGAAAALEAKSAGSGRTVLRDQARMSTRNAKRTIEISEQLAQMPNVARGLAVGDLTPEHVEVLADAARRTSPEAVDTAAELLETATEVAPEVLRHDARDFVARHDPDAARSVLDRQRRDRSAALFMDEHSGMGVLNARFDPISYALVQQALENYNDALWRLDGGRDGTPGQIRDNRQRLADSLFEMLTNRNALATIDHPTARTPNTDPGQHIDADAEGGQHSDTDGSRQGAAEPGQHSDTQHGHNADSEGGRRGSSEHSPGDGVEHRPDGSTEQRPDGGVVPANPAGRSIQHWGQSQAPNQLIVIADIGIIDGTKPDGLCEMLGAGPVPPEILDNLSPDTRISGALFDKQGQVLWLGRSRRHASTAQQLAIAIRDRGCVLCRKPMHRCRYHHIAEWAADNGTTDVPNLAALCDDCHKALHNNNQRLRRHAATRQWTAEPRTDTHTADRAAAVAASDAATARGDSPPHTPRE